MTSNYCSSGKHDVLTKNKTSNTGFKLTYLTRSLITAGALSVSMSASYLHAQEQEAAQAEADDNLVIEVINVTATKRLESIRDVPIAVSAYSGDALKKRGVVKLRDIEAISPSLTISNTTNTSQAIVRIRGIGTSGTSPGFESAVGTVIDGVVRSRPGHALGDLLDIQRIEVLRGPQGTLFGKNTSAGVMSLISNTPEFDFEASASATIGAFGERRFTGMINTPINDEWAFRIAATSNDRDGVLAGVEKQDDGSFKRIEDLYNDRNRSALKAQLLWEPNGDFSAKLIVDASTLDEVGTNGQSLFTSEQFKGLFNAFGAFVAPDLSLDQRVASTNTDPFEQTDDQGFSLEINWDLDWATLTSITASRQFETHRAYDLDLGSLDTLRPLDENNTNDILSQELRLTGDNDTLKWQVGAFAFREEIGQTSEVIFGPVGTILTFASADISGQGQEQELGQDATGYALFGEINYSIGDNLNFITGLRYSIEDKEAFQIINGAPFGTNINQPICTLIPPPVRAALGSICDNVSFQQDRDEDEFSGTVKLIYQLSKNTNIYGGYSRGYKAGGFNLDRQAVQQEIDPTTQMPTGNIIDTTQFDSEIVDSYEGGLKTTLWGGRSNLNVAVYYSDYDGFQLNSFDGVSFLVLSLPEVVSKGVEIESSTLLAEGVSFDLGIGYNKAEFGDDLNVESIQKLDLRETIRASQGKTLPQAPEWQISSAISVDRDIPDSNLRALFNISYSFRDSSFNSSSRDPLQEQKAFSLLNASIGIRTEDDKYGLILSGSNLTDQEACPIISATIFQSGSFTCFLNEPRTWSLTVDAKF